jgi:predicted transcriptional regulator
MDDALDDVRFLASSENRVRVLRALAGGSGTRRRLQEDTDVPRSSVARVLDEGEARDWVGSSGSQYWITGRGEAMLSTIERAVASTQGVRHLGRALEWLPDPVETLDVRQFRTARVTTPTEDNPTAALDRGLELIRGASVYRGLTRNSLPSYMRAIGDLVERGSLDFEAVLEADFVDVLRADGDRARRWRPVADRTWLYEGRVPINMHIVDERVAIWLCDESEHGDEVRIRGLLESDAPDVLSWAESLYEDHRAEATPMEADTLPATG